MARRRDPEAEDARYLAMRRAKLSYREIAKERGVSYRTVYLGVNRARERERYVPPPPGPPPSLVLSFGSSNKPLKLLTCDDVHRGPIPKGSTCCCGVCHKSGVDHLPAMRRDPRTDPKPEPKLKPPIEKKVKGKTKHRALGKQQPAQARARETDGANPSRATPVL